MSVPIRRRDFLQLATLAPALRFVGVRTPLNSAELSRTPGQSLSDISSLITAKMSEYHVPGVALGIFKNGQTSLKCFGVTNVDDPQPITEDTIFTIASISKTMTVTAFMRLAEQGRMDIDATVQKYLPDFRVQDEAASRQVQIRHLLTHSPGWEGQLSSADKGADSLADFAMHVLRDVPQLAEPGEVWSYNNAGFSLAGYVIEVVTGRVIHDALREQVFAPLGLARTFTRLQDAATYRLSLGHSQRGDRTQVTHPYQSTSGVTAGGVMTSISDLMTYARFHLSDGAGADGKPHISLALLERMKTGQLTKNSTEDLMGVGWHLRDVGGLKTCAHGGTLNNHCLLIELVPARNLAFAILTNHADGWRLVQDVEAAILKSYENVALTPNQRIAHRGVNEAMTFHSKPLATQPKLEEYVGTYQRPPNGTVNVRLENNQLIIGGGGGGGGTTVTFYGKDVAYATAGSYVGSPYEFIRTADDKLRWIRVNGRIARRSEA